MCHKPASKTQRFCEGKTIRKINHGPRLLNIVFTDGTKFSIKATEIANKLDMEASLHFTFDPEPPKENKS